MKKSGRFWENETTRDKFDYTTKWYVHKLESIQEYETHKIP